MRTISFDIFDTCLVRKCGTAQNFFDVFSLRAFNDEVEEWVRQEYVAARVLAERSISSPSTTLQSIWEAFSWQHPQLKSKDELCKLELELEREMLVPVLEMRDKVNECRAKGYHVMFISDMYLPSAFLREIMCQHGFLQDGDSLYVSCECNAEKSSGELFKYISEKEGLSFHCWYHYGDNKISDYKVPRKLGIKSILVKHEYTPYQKQWVDNDFSLGFKYPSIIAGMGRALHYSTEWTTHTDFVLDIIAPFYCSLVYRMMKDAETRGVKRLYFCARDAYNMFLIAQQYRSVFPSIECVFLYISRKALYEGDEDAKLAYFESIGLATQKDYVGIVDIRSTGRTLAFLNDYLASNGYRRVRGYYYELFIQMGDSQYSLDDYYTELSDKYNERIGRKVGFFSHIFEVLFPMNVLYRTVGYQMNNNRPEPVFDYVSGREDYKEDEVEVLGKEYWAKKHEELLMLYIKLYIETSLYLFSDEVFGMANQTLLQFLTNPDKYYLGTLECLYGRRGAGYEMRPYVKRERWLRLLFTRGKDTLWKQATLRYNNFEGCYRIYRRLLYGENM